MLTGWRLTLSKCFLLPQRAIVGIMGAACVMVAYTLRVCLNIAITQMVKSRPHSISHDPDACPDLEASTTNSTGKYGEYDWSEKTQGVVLGAFYYGYLITHIPSAIVAEKYGAKHTLGFGILLTALLTLVTPAVVRAGGDNPTGIIIIRVVEGLGEGPTMPAMAVLMSRWVPSNERGMFGSIIFGGAQLGNIFGTVISGFVMKKDGNWPNVFYIFGTIGVVWFICWQLLVYSDFRVHPFISDKEREYLESEIPRKSLLMVPWRYVLTSLPIWAVAVATVGHDWGYYTMVTDLPKYMNDVLKYSIHKTGLLSALPYLIMWIASFMFGGFCDWCIRKGYISIRTARKIFTTIAAMGPGVFILAASYAGCDKDLAVAMFCVAMGLMGAYYCGMKVNALDLTPNYSGSATALINGTGSLSGILTPYVIGALTPDQTQGQWRVAFWIVFVILSVTNLFYVIFAKGEVQWWNDMEVNADERGRRIIKKEGDKE